MSKGGTNTQEMSCVSVPDFLEHKIIGPVDTVGLIYIHPVKLIVFSYNPQMLIYPANSADILPEHKQLKIVLRNIIAHSGPSFPVAYP